MDNVVNQKAQEEKIPTNYEMCLSFDLKPKYFGRSTNEEVRQMRQHFRIAERSNVELQNLRDFVVMFYHMRSTEASTQVDQLDIMSAITGVIDNEKFHRGLPV